MRKLLILIMTFLFVTSITACKLIPDDPPVEKPPVEEAKIDSVEYSREGSTLVINVKDADYKGTELGVVVLVNKHFKDNWKNDSSVLIDLGQISVGENGEGSVTLTVPEDYTRFAFCITAPDCEYVESVGG